MTKAEEMLNSLVETVHEHPVLDDDTIFAIDPVTRNIIGKENERTILVQGDHNSERLTFKIPRYIEGHDMALCNLVYVAYINIEDSQKHNAKTGVYLVDDLNISDDPDYLNFTWLISSNATGYIGTLDFMVMFSCISKSIILDYRWNTNVYKSIHVLESIDAPLSFETEYLDVIEQWKANVFIELTAYIESNINEYGKELKNELYSSLTAYLNEGLSKADTNIKNLSNALNAQASRIDNFVSLQEGSTTGDAELADIRVDFDGAIYNSAGSSVRGSTSVLNNVKQKAYGSFEVMTSVDHTNVVYQVVSKVEQAIENGLYSEYEVTNETMLLVSGFAWSSYEVFPLGAFYDSSGNLLKKIGYTESKTYTDILVYVPVRAARLIVNGKAWSEPLVKKFVSGDLEGDISNIKKTLSSKSLVSNIKTYEELAIEADEITLSEANTELLEAQMYTSEGKIESGVLSESTYDTLYYPVGSYVSFLLSSYTTGVYGGAFLDENKNWISSFKTDYPNNLEEKVVPEGAFYIAITVNSTYRYRSIIGYKKTYELDGLKIKREHVLSSWAGKKIVWIGSSVSFGQYATTSYPAEAAKQLGFELVNCSVPGLAIHTNTDGSMLTYGSLSLSKAEYTSHGWSIPDEPIKYTPGGSYNNYYRTYENVFNEANADADLYVFDVVPNNTNFDKSDWNAFDFANWQYLDGSDFADHRSTFLGALLFLMDKMYSINPDARMIFVLGSGFNYYDGKTAFELVHSKWNIPLLDCWNQINTSPKSLLKIFSENGTNSHPSTFAHELMGRMLSNDLNSIC